MQESFSGPLRGQSSPNSALETVHSSHSHSHCSHHSSYSSSSSYGGITAHPGSLLEAEKYQLMYRAVQSSHKNGPLIRLDLERFNHIAVDVVATKIHSSVHVLYVSTGSDGLIRKYSILPRTKRLAWLRSLTTYGLNALLYTRAVSVRALEVVTAHTRKMVDQVNFKMFFLNKKKITNYFIFVYFFIFSFIQSVPVAVSSTRCATCTPVLKPNGSLLGRLGCLPTIRTLVESRDVSASLARPRWIRVCLKWEL